MPDREGYLQKKGRNAQIAIYALESANGKIQMDNVLIASLLYFRPCAKELEVEVVQIEGTELILF